MKRKPSKINDPNAISRAINKRAMMEAPAEKPTTKPKQPTTKPKKPKKKPSMDPNWDLNVVSRDINKRAMQDTPAKPVKTKKPGKFTISFTTLNW